MRKTMSTNSAPSCFVDPSPTSPAASTRSPTSIPSRPSRYSPSLTVWSGGSADFTAGPKEAAAWTVTRGTKAPQAAAAIHSDFERGFIRAETIAYDDYVQFGGENGARDAGKMRLEGKT